MLPKKNKLSKKLFSLAWKNGKVFNSPLLSVFLYKNEDNKDLKISAVISKKISKKAVDRNMIKRRVYNICNNNINLFLPGFSYIFIFRKGIEKLSFVDIEKEIMSFLKKNNLLN